MGIRERTLGLATAAMLIGWAAPVTAFEPSDMTRRVVEIRPIYKGSASEDTDGHAAQREDHGVGIVLTDRAIMTAAHVLHPNCTCADGKLSACSSEVVGFKIRAPDERGEFEETVMLGPDAKIDDVEDPCRVDIAVLALYESSKKQLPAPGAPPFVLVPEHQINGEGQRCSVFESAMSCPTVLLGSLERGITVGGKGTLANQAADARFRLDNEGTAGESGSPVYSNVHHGVVGIFTGVGTRNQMSLSTFGVATWLGDPRVQDLYERHTHDKLRQTYVSDRLYEQRGHVVAGGSYRAVALDSADDANWLEISAGAAYDLAFLREDHETALQGELSVAGRHAFYRTSYLSPAGSAELDDENDTSAIYVGPRLGLNIDFRRLENFGFGLGVGASLFYVSQSGRPEDMDGTHWANDVFFRARVAWRTTSRLTVGPEVRLGYQWAPARSYRYTGAGGQTQPLDSPNDPFLAAGLYLAY